MHAHVTGAILVYLRGLQENHPNFSHLSRLGRRESVGSEDHKDRFLNGLPGNKLAHNFQTEFSWLLPGSPSLVSLGIVYHLYVSTVSSA